MNELVFRAGSLANIAAAVNRTQKNRCLLGFLTAFLAITAPRAHAWTMYYDGFAYEPASTDTVNYRLPQTSPCADTVTTEYPYHLGDPRYYAPDNAIPDTTSSPSCASDRHLSDQTGSGGKNFAPYKYATAGSSSPGTCSPITHSGVSQWVGSDSSQCFAYWPFIAPGIPGDDPAGFVYSGAGGALPAPTGHVVVCFGSANNSGRVSRVSPVNLNMSPPNDPSAFRRFRHGTLYYSVLVKPREMTTVVTPGHGAFYAGFENNGPNATLPSFNGTSIIQTPALTRACARLKFRTTATANKVQIGVQNDDGTTNLSEVWDTNNLYDAGSAAPNSPLFVVVSYEFKPGTDDDVARMWVNPDYATLGAATPPTYTVGGTSYPLTTTVGADIQDSEIRSFFLREGPNSGAGLVQRVVFDELRIGLSWADVTSDVPCGTPATINGITPSSASQAATAFPLSITGANFVQGPTHVKLTMTGQPDIVANDVNVSDSGHLVATFDLTGAALGLWSVVVETCVGSPSTLTDALTIVCNAPGVTSISPSFKARGTTVTGAAVAGSNFVATGTQVTLTMSGQPDIVGTAENVTDSAHLTVNFTIPGAAVPGKRSVVVTTCGTPATLADAFTVTCNPPADFNCDTFVDGLDFTAFTTCAPSGGAGAGVPLTAGCEVKDLNHDGSIDMNDFALFQRCFAGSAIPANVNCAN